jgi:hypothetical protein
MLPALRSDNEAERLRPLRSLGLLDAELDRVTRTAARHSPP